MSDVSEQQSAADETRRNDLEKAYRAVFMTAEGKKVLFDILETCGLYSAVFTGDNNATNFRLGMQEPGKALIARLDQFDNRFYPQLLLTIAELREMEKAAEQRAANKGQEDNDIDA